MIRYNLRYRLKIRRQKVYGVQLMGGHINYSYWDKVKVLTNSLKESGLNIESHMGFPDGTISYIINGDSTDEVSFFLMKHSDTISDVEIKEL